MVPRSRGSVSPMLKFVALAVPTQTSSPTRTRMETFAWVVADIGVSPLAPLNGSCGRAAPPDHESLDLQETLLVTCFDAYTNEVTITPIQTNDSRRII